LFWEDGSESYEPLEMIIKDDLVTLASYALKHDLLGHPRWKKLIGIDTKLHCKHVALSEFAYEVLSS
jgi:DNA-directed RNA polymerase subunit L